MYAQPGRSTEPTRCLQTTEGPTKAYKGGSRILGIKTLLLYSYSVLTL